MLIWSQFFFNIFILFNLVCILLIILFEDYNKLFERDANALVYMEARACLCYHFSKISHRFCIFLLLPFLDVMPSQFVFFFQTTGYSGKVNFTNVGELAVFSVNYTSLIDLFVILITPGVKLFLETDRYLQLFKLLM